MYLSQTVFQRISLASKYQNHCPAYLADVDRAIVLVENKDFSLYNV